MSLSLVNWIVSLPDVSSLVCPARAEGGGGCRGRWFPRGCPSSWSLGVVGGRWAWESGNGEGAEALAYRVLEEVSTLSPWVAAFLANSGQLTANCLANSCGQFPRGQVLKPALLWAVGASLSKAPLETLPTHFPAWRPGCSRTSSPTLLWSSPPSVAAGATYLRGTLLMRCRKSGSSLVTFLVSSPPKENLHTLACPWA